MPRGGLDAGPLPHHSDAFPSGHAAFTLTLALLLGGYYPHARPYFLLVVLAVMVERVANASRFGSDLAGGAIVAVLSVALCRWWLGAHAFEPARAE
ncbi:MAG: phosphatase PAP2 family protein [Planctomycetota bacterium]|nr:MAG: phosphatase PAP2 family protein [Planctomycetota bacterium]